MNFFEIRDTEIDTSGIKQVLNKQIVQRRSYAQAHSLDFETLAKPVHFNEETRRWMLELLEHHQAAILIEPYVIPTNQGLWGHLLGLIKKQFHQLAIYYVNLLGQKQILFNINVVEAMAFHQIQIEKLQETVNSLEAKCQSLETLLTVKEI